MITVIDYGMGNLKSVSKALETVDTRVKVSNNPEDVLSADAIVLPGVGAFHRAMENLEGLGILPSIFKAIEDGKPFLGICLGLQLLFTESEEHGVHKGLDIVKGKVKRFDSGLKIPHMGWNQVGLKKAKDNAQSPQSGQGIDLFNNIPDNSYFYFVHAYYVEPEDKEIVVGITEYGKDFVSIINKDNIWGVQFHPEKSSGLGLKILENFCQYAN